MDYWWNELPNHFKNEIDLDEYVIMPNHVHGIIVIKNVGADRRVCPNIKLGNIIQWFKTMTTNEYIKKIKSDDWPKFDKRIWQRNYYERIIRNEKEYRKIREYIKMNPKTWERDRNNLANVGADQKRVRPYNEEIFVGVDRCVDPKENGNNAK